MYILVDKMRKAILYRAEKVETLRALANIELAYSRVAIFEETNIEVFYNFPVYFLQELFKSLTGGTDPHSHSAEYLVGQIVRLCQTAKPSNVDGFEAVVQSLQIQFHDKDHYRYAKGESRAKMVEDPYYPPPLLGNWTAAQGLPLPTVQTAQPAPVQPAQHAPAPWVQAAPATPPKYAPPWL